MCSSHYIVILGSIHGLAGIPSILLPNIMQWRGRKFAFIAACLVTVVGWITAYTAQSAAALLVAESFHGLGTNSILAVSYLSISEMISPEYRHAYMQMYAVLQTLTMAMNGLMTQYVNWRTISVIMCAPMLVAIPVACMWPESPYWLAIKGEFDKCEEAFTWLRGVDDISKKELKDLVNAQKENIAACKKKSKKSSKQIWSTITRRDFYLPSLHSFVLQYLFYWSGNYVILIYSIELIQKSTQNENAALFGGFIMNLLLCFGIVTSIVLNRLFNKKTILLWCTSFVVVSMLSASVVTFLQSVDVLSKRSSLCLYCLIAYMIANGIGIVPIAYNIAIEIMPVKHRGIGGALIVVCSCVLHSTSLKISPYLFLYIDLWGTFLFYTINSLFCGIFIWKFVPETKDKTLQEIEDYYMYGGYKMGHVLDEYFEDPDQGEEMLPINKC